MSSTAEPVELRRRVLRRASKKDSEHEDPISPPFQSTSLEYDVVDTGLTAEATDDDVKGKVASNEDSLPPIQPINWVFVGLLTIAAYFSRFYKISAGNFVLYSLGLVVH